MKIALAILHADPARGGAERYTIDLAHGLARRGHEVAVVASSFGARPAGVECIELPPRRRTRTGKYNQFLADLLAHREKAGYDLWHAMLPVTRCDVYHPHAGVAVEAIRSGHMKHASPMRRMLAAVFNRFNPRRLRFAAVERQLLSERPRPITICLSDYVAATVRQHYDLPAGDLATLFNSVDLEKYDPAARPGERREIRRRYDITDSDTVALIVAQDFARKGLAEAIGAVAGLAEGERPLLLVVGKDSQVQYRRLTVRLGIEKRVVFAGSTTDVYPYYAAADYFLLPTRHDPCSLVVLEALAMGLPVISTRQNGACEIITPGQHGFVLDSADDVSGLATAMKSLAEPSLRELMSNACLALRPRLSYEAHLDTLEGIYARAVRK